MDDLLQNTRSQMQKALQVLHDDMNTIRTGKAAPSLVENLVISAYGGSTKLKVMELATVAATDAQTLVLTPFDPSIVNELQKGIQDSNTGLSPVVDGHLLRIALPPLSQERREQLIHLMKQKLENGKILIRQSRHEAMTDVKKAEVSEDEEHRVEKEVQKITDEFIGQIDSMGKQKEQELLKI